jgi:hypothetical protein
MIIIHSMVDRITITISKKNHDDLVLLKSMMKVNSYDIVLESIFKELDSGHYKFYESQIKDRPMVEHE